MGPPEEGIGEARDVIVIGIVDKNTGVIVQVWRQVDVSLDPAARGADRLPGHGIECLEDAATHLSKSLPSVHFTLKSEAVCQVHSKVEIDSPGVRNNPSRRLDGGPAKLAYHA